MNKHEIILGSSSPRRQAMLRELGLTCRIIVPDILEEVRPGESADAFAVRAAREKAEAVARSIEERAVVITGDTVVVLGERIMGKPVDRDEACHMLRSLSGRHHQVMSGLCVAEVEQGLIQHATCELVSTDVAFRELSDVEIQQYVDSGEPMDKAGAYAIQGGAASMVARISGSYTNVIGLPLAELVTILKRDFGWLTVGS